MLEINVFAVYIIIQTKYIFCIFIFCSMLRRVWGHLCVIVMKMLQCKSFWLKNKIHLLDWNLYILLLSLWVCWDVPQSWRTCVHKTFHVKIWEKCKYINPASSKQRHRTGFLYWFYMLKLFAMETSAHFIIVTVWKSKAKTQK